ncbi:MAG: isopentenyl-diphosphate Delta-isomerase [Cytophagales bacterium]|nr:isopentenyl-diphosphate Delta-isomerase [Cytophaga sp.]
MNDKVVLVDTNDQPVAIMDKLEAHEKGLLHRAFSIFLFNSNKEFLLQKRALNKYHSAGLWSNTCCSHPKPDEALIDAADRRLKEEMGLSTDLSALYSFIYKVDFQNGLTEHELDHILTGFSDEVPLLNADEADEWKYLSFEDLTQEVTQHPELFTEWFKMCYEQVFHLINQK